MPTQWSEAEQVPLGCIAPHDIDGAFKDKVDATAA